MKKLPLFVLVGLFLTTSLMGCNTVKGAGQDVSDAGQSVSHAAQAAQ
jgi:predicted small secreted protein